MRPVWIVLIAIALAAVVRLARRRRRRGAREARPVASRGRTPFGETGLIAGREIRERLRGRVFRIVTAILFLAVGAAIVIPTLHTAGPARATVGVVAATPSLDAELAALAHDVGLTVHLSDETGLATARARLASGALDIVVDAPHSVLVPKPISSSDTSASARFVRDVSLALGEQRAFARAGLSASQARIVATARPLSILSLHATKARTTTSEATALIGVILIFIVLTQYLTWTLMGVMEEKASRVVEVLLATVRPLQLLAGKVTGIGIVALAQATALVAFALVLGSAVGSSLVHGSAPWVVASTFVWLVLGYAFYSWLYAAAGSLAERQDQVQSLALPLSLPLILGYIVSLVGVSSGSASTLVKVLAYIPPTAPFAMTTLVGFGEATWWQFSISVVLSLASTVFVALGASRIYRAAVLRTGGRVRLRQLRQRPAPAARD